MRAAVRLIAMICLVWCALGVAEPVAAHEDSPAHQVVGDGQIGDAADGATDPCDPAGHHHCPVAPDLRLAPAAASVPSPAAQLFPTDIAALSSLSRAPPLQPPSA